MPVTLTQGSLSIHPPHPRPNLGHGMPGGYLAQALWKAPGLPAPLSCARGPLGGRKQCIVMLASRISCSGPGAG